MKSQCTRAPVCWSKLLRVSNASLKAFSGSTGQNHTSLGLNIFQFGQKILKVRLKLQLLTMDQHQATPETVSCIVGVWANLEIPSQKLVSSPSLYCFGQFSVPAGCYLFVRWYLGGILARVLPVLHVGAHSSQNVRKYSC